jgi:phosphopantothenoylcysteine decarboxylase/phosphopantothenate--cysteine ligase
MNNRMYLHPATRANLRTLAERGVEVIPPGEGELASHGEHGIGRLAEPPELLAACERLLTPPTWSGVSVLVTAGGTREPIDSVRYIGNRSSGRMGYALAAEAVRRGAEVTVAAANVSLDSPPRARVINVGTAAELKAVCEEWFERCDVLLMAAAVADFRPAGAATTKIKKDGGPPLLQLESTDDILASLAERRRPGQVLVGFAAEHGEGAVDYGRGKLERKRLDIVVVNDIGNAEIGFDVQENEVTILTALGGERHVQKSAKAKVAQEILDQVEAIRTAREGEDGATGADTRSAARA